MRIKRIKRLVFFILYNKLQKNLHTSRVYAVAYDIKTVKMGKATLKVTAKLTPNIRSISTIKIGGNLTIKIRGNLTIKIRVNLTIKIKRKLTPKN